MGASAASRPRDVWSPKRAAVLAAFAGVLMGTAVLMAPPKYVIVGAALLAALIGMVLDPLIGLMALLGYYFLRPDVIIPELGALHLQRFLVLAVFGAWLLNRAARRSRPLVRHRTNLAMLLFLASMAATIPLADWPGRAFSTTLDFAKMVVLYALVANLADTERRLRGVLWFIVLSFGLITSLQLLGHMGVYSGSYVTVATIEDQHLGSVYVRSGGVAKGFLGNPDDYAVGLLFVIPLAAALLLQARSSTVRMAAMALVGLLIYGLTLTGSRGGVAGAAAVIFFLWAVSGRKALTAVIGVALAATLWLAAPQSFRDRINTLPAGSYRTDSGVQARFDAWAVAWRMFLEHPVTGVGAGNYVTSRWARYRAPDERDVLTAHSLYYLLAAEQGLLGITAFAFLIGTAFASNRRVRAHLRRTSGERARVVHLSYALDASLVGYLVSGAFITVLMYPYPYLIAALVVALANSTPRPAPATAGEKTAMAA